MSPVSVSRNGQVVHLLNLTTGSFIPGGLGFETHSRPQARAFSDRVYAKQTAIFEGRIRCLRTPSNLTAETMLDLDCGVKSGYYLLRGQTES